MVLMREIINSNSFSARDRKNMSTRNDDLIFDVGMHKGQDTIFYLKKGFRVVGFEANPELVKYCKNRFSDYIESGKLTIVEGAIVENPEIKKVAFYLNPEMNIWGTVNENFVKRNERCGFKHKKIELKAINFSDYLSKYGIPYYLKVDIEGSDKACIKALYNFSEKPRFVSIESDKLSFEGIIDEISLLWDLGYRGFKAIQQLTTSEAIPPYPAKEGIYVDHTFKFGSSGLFGEETEGKWLDVEELVANYKRIFLKYRLFGDYSILRLTGILRLSRILFPPFGLWPGWYDIHAKIPN
jgi:FkbM family methyltransferase